jgi:hypothetical protein
VGDFVFNLAGTEASSADEKVEFNSLGTGSYTLTVTDKMGCSSDSSFVLPVISEPLHIRSFAISQASCLRAANAKISLVAAGSIPGNPGYYFVLNNTDTQYGQTVEFANRAVGGINRVYLYDQYGCADNTPAFAFPVKDDTLNIEFASKVNPACPAYANGSISFTALNGTPFPQGFLYMVFNAQTNDFVKQVYGEVSQTLQGLPQGNYFVTVSDQDNCLAQSDPVQITDPDTIHFVVKPGYVAAKGASTGWANAMASGGNQKYIIEWYQGTTVSDDKRLQRDTSFSASYIHSLTAGNYLVRVKDTANCVFWNNEWLEKPISIAEPGEALALTLAKKEQVSCKDRQDGVLTLQASGGWGNGYVFGSDINFLNGASPVFGNLKAGDYTFFVKDTSGIVASATYVMTEPDKLIASVAKVIPANCYGSLDGSIEMNVTGGNSAFAISGDGVSWHEGLVLSALKAGDYTVSVRDDKNCTSSGTASVLQPQAMVIADTSITNTQCKVNEGKILVTPAGGIPAYAYAWFNEGTLVGQGAPEIDSMYSGQYVLHLVDAHLCSRDFSFYISDVTDLKIDTLITIPVSCWGNSDGSASASIAKGFPPYTLRWPGDVLADKVTGLASNTYLLSVSDIEGCKVYRNFTIGSPDDLGIATGRLENPLCYGVPDGSIEVVARGGTAPYSYLWNTGHKKNTLSGMDTATYTLVLSDSHNCHKTYVYTLHYQDSIALSLPSKLTLCRNNNYTLDGGDFAWHTWRKDGNILSQEKRLTVNTVGSYSLEVEDSRGCKTTDTVQVGLSESDLQAQFLMASQISQQDTVVIFEASEPVPDSISLQLPTSFHVIESGQYYRYATVTDTGTFEITLVAYRAGCQDVIRKDIQVLEAGAISASAQNAETDLIRSVRLYPNPTSGNFTVEIELSQPYEAYLRLVSFSNGSTLSLRKVTGSSSYSVPYNLANPSPGAYLLNIRVGNQMKNVKIIIL